MTAGTECVIRAAASADAGAIITLAIELARHVRDPDPKLSAEYLEAQLFSTDPWRSVWSRKCAVWRLVF